METSEESTNLIAKMLREIERAGRKIEERIKRQLDAHVTSQ